MEILSPSPPPSPARNQFVYGGAGALLRRDQAGAGALLHVAVGRSPEKTLPLLRWAFRRFACARVALVHVHQPSPVIPTLLGKIPAAQATEELVLSHRRSERDDRNRILLAYIAFCQRAQVQATVLVTENEQINDGIVALVRDHGVTKLVMGSIPDNCFKLKAGHNKEYFMAKNAPAFCEIWFVWRGRHIWTREASAAIDNSISVYNQDDIMMTRKRTRFSPNSNGAESMLDGGYITCGTSTVADLHVGAVSDNGRVNGSGALGADANHFYNMRISNLQDAESAFNSALWSDSSVLGGALQLHSKEMMESNLKQVMVEAEGSRKEAFLELLKRKEIESKVDSAFIRVKAAESSKKREMKIREELEDLFLATRKQHEDLATSKEKAMTVLGSSMRRLDILDARAKNMSLRMDEAVAELEVIQSSINILKQERTKAHKLEDSYNNRVEEGCTYSHSKFLNHSSIALGDDPYTFKQLTLLDVQAATFKFSESFKLRQWVHGCIYKGKVMNRSVMIHKLHSHSIKSLMQFQREVYILNKVRHPHLVTLVGVCPDALCLAYEYPKNGSLHDHLFGELNSTPQLPWKIRSRIVTEISSALMFLHSCKPQMMVHGGLNLENVLLDTDFHCKIADFGTLTEEDSKDHPAFDSGLLAHKSDINSFGTMILQLLTGKRPGPGLAIEVSCALSRGKLSSSLDPTAGEWPMGAARRLAEFGLECSGDKPELSEETLRELEQLQLIRVRPVPSFFLCPILKETMDDPQVAADGVTYEGRAIREWIEDGRAVADLKLRHLGLTPNHALRFAIQDWLSQPQW
ncbi:U-box domain-containing protein 33 [Hordeum vulgare]|nr:U-box domain-containing protein 33 [Hordeum vulgare]